MSGLTGDVCVLLTPRAPGGHEVALFGWLGDAAQWGALRPAVVTPTAELARASRAAGLVPVAAPAADGADTPPAQLLRWLRRWPAERPLLLAPGVLHADAWLLACALGLRRRVWVYVPMAYTARHMGFRGAALRDRALTPWLRRVEGWITPDAAQAALLRTAWGVQAPVHALPNLARVQGKVPVWPPAAADRRLRVCVVGRYEPHQKGLDWLATLLRTQPAWSDRCHWRFQGRGSGERSLLELASALGPHRATVHAHAPLADALAASDVLLLCSRFEGVPLVALEATALGWPVLATRGNGLDELLPPQCLVDFGDTEGLAMALQALRRPAARLAAVHHARQQLDRLHHPDVYQAALQRVVAALKGHMQPEPAC